MQMFADTTRQATQDFNIIPTDGMYFIPYRYSWHRLLPKMIKPGELFLQVFNPPEEGDVCFWSKENYVHEKVGTRV